MNLPPVSEVTPYVHKEFLGLNSVIVRERVMLVRRTERIKVNQSFTLMQLARQSDRKVFPLVFTYGTVDAVSHPHCWTV